MNKANHQGYVEKARHDKTEFITPWGLYKRDRILLGLTNASFLFKCPMEDCLGSMAVSKATVITMCAQNERKD